MHRGTMVGDERLMATDPRAAHGSTGLGRNTARKRPTAVSTAALRHRIRPTANLSGWVPPPQAPKPGVIPLRPLGVAELLDGAITAIRRYPKAILLPSFVVALGVGAFGYLINLATIGYISDLNNLDPMTATVATSDVPVGPAVGVVAGRRCSFSSSPPCCSPG